jgi:hypothetical protein
MRAEPTPPKSDVPPDDDRGDRRKLVVGAEEPVPRVEPRADDEAADARAEPADHERNEPDPSGADPGERCRLGIATDRIEVRAESCPVEHEVKADE